MLSFKPAFSLFFHFPQEALQFLFAFCHKGGIICLLRFLIFPLAILISACDSSSLAFCTMYPAYKLNKQGVKYTALTCSFPNSEPVHCFMSNSNTCFLTCIQISQKAGQVVWHSHLFKNFPQFVLIHTVKGFSMVNEAEVEDFLELSCLFYDPMDVGNLISGCSAFSKSSLNIWKFMVHVPVKPDLENFEHYFASV